MKIFREINGERVEIELSYSEEYQVFMAHLRDHVVYAVEDHLCRDYDSFGNLPEERKEMIVNSIADAIMEKVEDIDLDLFDDGQIGYETDDIIESEEDYAELIEEEDDL